MLADGGLLIDDVRPAAAVREDHLADAAIVEAVLAGDRDAFRVLVERDGAAVVRACYRVLGDIHEAEDVAQEAFVTAFRSLAGWRREGPFGAWLSRIALRIALRTAAKRRTVTWINPAEPDASLEAAAPGGRVWAESAGRDPATLAMRAERAGIVRRAVARLDEPYREVVALRFFGDLALADIAAQTGRPLGTVKTHLHRGLARLRAALAEESVR